MKGCLPNWKMENDSRSFNGLTKEKNHIGPDNELIELVRRNGNVALHSQTSCRALSAICETKQILNPDSLLKCEDSNVNSSNFVDEDESGAWFQYHLDNSIEKEFFEVFNGILAAEPVTVDKTMREDINACAKQSDLYPHENTKALSNSSRDDSSAIVNFSNPQKLMKDDFVSERNFCEEASSSETVAGLGDSSSMNTIPFCGNNQAQNQVDVSRVWSKLSGRKGSLMRSLNDRLHEKAYESAIASSSGRSRRSTTSHGYKRKGRDAEEYEGFSEDVEYESADVNKPAQRPTSGRRSRSAEVHNLSERRRRDRINEKMRALQELIPHCNKSDKASMLDEVIEYLKSLRLQLQIMWMGNGVASMLCPNSQQYMSSMGIGMNQTVQNPVQIPRAASNDQSGARISMPNQPPVSFRQGLGSINFAAQMHDFHLPEQNSSYIGFPQMQLAPQVMNMCTFEPQILQQNQMVSAVDKQQHVNNKSSI